MLGRMLVIDSNVSSRFTLKARLGATNHQVQTASDVAEAMRNSEGISAVLLRNRDSVALARDIATLKRRLAVPVIAICDSAQRQVAFRAGAEQVLDLDCHDAVMRARLRCWMAPSADADPGFAEQPAEFVPPDQIALLTDDAALSSDWRCAVKAAAGMRLRILSRQALIDGVPASLAAVLVDGGPGGEGLQNLADLRVRLAADGRGTALAFLQRRRLAEEETRALEIGASEVLPAQLSAARHRAELDARLRILLKRGCKEARRQSDVRLARRLAAVDPLTGLANRRQISAELASAKYAERGFGLLMVDIDRFKAINDSFGHSAGDTVLRSVAARLSAEVGSEGRVGRYGGEEFLILLSSADETDAVSLAERIRSRISARAVPADTLSGPSEIPVSVSIGVAACERDAAVSLTTAEDLLRQADAALLAAKSAGRNLVMLSRQRDAA